MRPRKLKIGPKVNHVLVGGDGLGETALFHQRVAEQPVIEWQGALLDKFTGDGLGLRKTMEADKHMAAQQHRLGTFGVSHFQRSGTVLREFVESRIVAGSRLGDIQPAKLLQERPRLGRFSDAPLDGFNVAIKRVPAWLRAHRDLVGDRGPQLRVGLRRVPGARSGGCGHSVRALAET